MASESIGGKKVFCYCHIGGESVIKSQSVQYKGGETVGVMVNQNTTFNQFVNEIGEKLGKKLSGQRLKYTLDFDRTQFIDLKNDIALRDLISFSDRVADVFIFSTETAEACGSNQLRSEHTEQQSVPSSGDASNTITQNEATCVPAQEQMSPAVQCRDSPQNDATHVPAEKQMSHAVQFRDSPRNDATHVPAKKQTSPAVQRKDSSKCPSTSQSWENEILGSGQAFKDAAAFRQALYQFSIANKFSYRFAKNSRSYISTHCKVDDCPWHLTAYIDASTNSMVVGTFYNVHTHSAQDAIVAKPEARSKLAASFISEKLRLQPDITPHEIRSIFESEHGMTITYYQAWRVKEQSKMLVHGKHENSYKLIPWLCQRLMDADPYTVAKWTASSNLRFEQLFVAYGCSIMGFLNGCRPVLYVDICHLSGPYGGTLLSASAFDADNQIFPLAYAVVSSESFENWSWFFQNLKGLTGSMQVTIISDRNENVIESVHEAYGEEYHAYCYRHVKENFVAEVAKLMSSSNRVKETALKLLDGVTYARLEEDYDAALEILRKYRPELANWVLESEPEHWVMSKFPHPRWDQVTINADESFNAWLAKERHLNVFAFINEHREKLEAKIRNAKLDLKSWGNGVGHNIEEKLSENIARGEEMIVSQDAQYLAKVYVGCAGFSVNLLNHTCTCIEWQMSGIPCPHACAVIKFMNGNIYQFVAECYKKSMQELIYANSMVPIGMREMCWPETSDKHKCNSTDEVYLLPPLITKRPPGRPQVKCPQVKHIDSQFVKRRKTQCSRCHLFGHNRSSCKNSNSS